MNLDEYRAIDAVNWSSLKSLRISPKQYRHDLLSEREDSVSMRIGRAVHTMLLEPDAFPARHPVYGGSRRGKDWEAWSDAHAGADMLTGVEAARARNCADAVLDHPIAQRHMAKGAEEKVLRWTDATTGIDCKARCDLVNGHLVDIKTAADVQVHAFTRQAAQLGYPQQLAFYTDALAANGIETHADPAIVTVCNEEPHDVVVYVLQAEAIDVGRRLYKRLLARLADCRATDKWPGIAEDGEVFLLLPEWAAAEAEEKITMGGVEICA
jgi:hypothetical protein